MSVTNEKIIAHVTDKAEEVKTHVSGVLSRLEKPTDKWLLRIEKSGASVVIVGAWTIGMIALGGWLF